VLDGIITTIMATIQRINIIGSREGSRNRRRLKANQTGKKFRVGIKSNISTNRNNLISGVDRCIHLNAMKKTTITTHHERQKQPYGRQHTYHHYRTQRPAYEKTESLPRAWCGYPSAYGSQALGIEKE